MKHLKKLGNCDKCGDEVVSPFDRKEHVIGDIRGGALVLGRYREGQRL